MELRTHRTLVALRSAWRKLHKTTVSSASVYQSYFVNAAVKRRMPIYALQEKYTVRYLELRDDGETVLIVPLCRYWGRKDYCSLGKFNGFQVYDFIYSKDMTAQKMEEYLSFILSKQNPTVITLENVPQSSMLYKCVENAVEFANYDLTITQNDNVSITVGESYDLWVAGLSKSARQNLRTAYNRMAADGVDMCCKVYRGERINRKLLNQLIDIYCDRHSDRYGVPTSSVKKWYLKYLDFSTACQQHYQDNLCVVIYMNGKIAAFLSGMIEKEGTSAVIPRLSIVDEFARYSPGMVLINETLKRFTSDLRISCLDLSKGAERYKLTMGGNLYHTYSMKLVRKTQGGNAQDDE